MAEDSQTLLSVRGVTVRFGGIVALDGVTFDVSRGHERRLRLHWIGFREERNSRHRVIAHRRIHLLPV